MSTPAHGHASLATALPAPFPDIRKPNIYSFGGGLGGPIITVTRQQSREPSTCSSKRNSTGLAQNRGNPWDKPQRQEGRISTAPCRVSSLLLESTTGFPLQVVKGTLSDLLCNMHVGSGRVRGWDSPCACPWRGRPRSGRHEVRTPPAPGRPGPQFCNLPRLQKFPMHRCFT